MTEITFWKDRENRTVDPFLFSEKAMNFAKKIADDDKKRNNRTQIRKFYDEVTRLDALAGKCGDPGGPNWETILPVLHMLVAKAAYAQGRNLVTRSFTDFIKESVFQVKDPEDLKVFTDFFESFMGFYKLYRPRN